MPFNLLDRLELVETRVLVHLVNYDSHKHLQSGLVNNLHAANRQALLSGNFGLKDSPPHKLAAGLNQHDVQLTREALLLDGKHQSIVEVLPEQLLLNLTLLLLGLNLSLTRHPLAALAITLLLPLL